MLWDQLIAVRDRDRSVCDLARLELALSPDDPVDFALKRLVEQRRGSLPVVEDKRVIGALSQHGARTMLGLETKEHIRWRPPRFTAPMRGQARRTVTGRALGGVAAGRALDRVSAHHRCGTPPTSQASAGASARLARRGGSTLDEREARVEAVRDTWLGRLLERRADGTVEATHPSAAARGSRRRPAPRRGDQRCTGTPVSNALREIGKGRLAQSWSGLNPRPTLSAHGPAIGKLHTLRGLKYPPPQGLEAADDMFQSIRQLGSPEAYVAIVPEWILACGNG